MRILDRYIGRQVLTTALFAIAVLSLVLVLGNVFKQLLDLLVNHDVPLEYILSFIAYIIPFSLTFTIPWGFLTAVLLIFGRLSAENELIALRSNGISIPRVALPPLLLSLVCVGICFWINVDVAPEGAGADEGGALQHRHQQPDRHVRQRPGDRRIPRPAHLRGEEERGASSRISSCTS